MKIICDTNVWYLLTSEPDYLPEAELILTATNFFDWYASERMDPNHEKHEKLLDSYRTAKSYHSKKLIIDPFDFPAVKFTNYKILEKTSNSFQAAENSLDKMIEGNYDILQIENIRIACSKAKNQFVAGIKNNNDFLFQECSNMNQSIESGKYKLKKNVSLTI